MAAFACPENNKKKEIMKITTNKNTPRITLGNTIVRCFKLVDVGTQIGMYDFKPTRNEKIIAYYEMPDGKVITKIYTKSLHTLATLRKDLESWKGTPFSQAELADFDLTWMLNRYCRVSVRSAGHANFGRVSVENFTALDENEDRPKPIHEVALFDLDKPDAKLYATFNQGVRNMIEKSEEWPRVREQLAPSKQNASLTVTSIKDNSANAESFRASA